MIKYLEVNDWKIREIGFDPAKHRSSESIFSIGNGKFGQRACFEEEYSGKTLQGSYVAGIYYPDKTRVGWWKNGYPEYFAKVLNATNWIGIRLRINGETLDLHSLQVKDFVRELDMKQGLLKRSFVAVFSENREVKVEACRFCSMADDETACLTYKITPLNFSASVELVSYLNGDVRNQDSNYGEGFWEFVNAHFSSRTGTVETRTKKTDFGLAVSMINELELDNKIIPSVSQLSVGPAAVEESWVFSLEEGQEATLSKYVGITSSLNYPVNKLCISSQEAAARAAELGFNAMRLAHASVWEEIWEFGDIQIEGDEEAQQGIRFNIFQLNQTYSGKDERLNIGPKGFTGEKYGGSTYWDTEAYCIPFYLATRQPHVARQLLIYRYRQLDKAIENAARLGFGSGAALYPMVTMNGEECHNEWEITFEEIHRNGAIAYAIFNYVRYSGDRPYLAEYGFEVLLGIARFWSQRVNWSEQKNAWVILGVTGPNEYENNVNNNWYTNYIAAWCLRYTLECLEYLDASHTEKLSELTITCGFNREEETEKWRSIIAHMYYPRMDNSEVVLQQDGFLDKEIQPASALDPTQRPINQHWSWDRILRSVYIKQADVLQGMYFFSHEISETVIRSNFDFYEPLTVHESSLSPCVHVVLASRLGYSNKAYELYLRTSRLDLDDYNHEVHEGLHITSMAGTWMSVVEGFGGMRVKEDKLCLDPAIPEQWNSYSFHILFRGHLLLVSMERGRTSVTNKSEKEVGLFLRGAEVRILPNATVEVLSA